MPKNIVKKNNNNQLALTIKENDLADIILNFLGKKETLTYEQKDINFKLYRNDIEQFYYLLNTKIEKESYSNITHFSATFFYNDNTKREINGINALNSFLETRDVVPKKIILSWNIILSFPNTEKIENQEISVEFNIAKPSNSMSISIKHTNPVWGTEVLNLFQEYSKSLIIEKLDILVSMEKIILYFYHREPVNILILAPISLFIAFYIYSNLGGAGYKEENKYKIEILSKLIKDENKYTLNSLERQLVLNYLKVSSRWDSSLDTSTIEVIQNKEVIKLIQSYKNKKEENVFFNIKVLLNLIGVYLGLLLSIYLLLKQNIKYFSEKSFILITTRAEKTYELYKKSKSKVEYYSFSLIAFSIIIGLLVNALYQVMS